MKEHRRILIAAIPILVVMGLMFARKPDSFHVTTVASPFGIATPASLIAKAATKTHDTGTEPAAVRVATEPVDSPRLTEAENALLSKHLTKLHDSLHRIEAENMRLLRKEEANGHFRAYLKIIEPDWGQLNRMNAAVDREAAAFQAGTPLAQIFSARASSALREYTRFPTHAKVVDVDIPLEDDTPCNVSELWSDSPNLDDFGKPDVLLTFQMGAVQQVNNTAHDWTQSHYGWYFPVAERPEQKPASLR